MNKDNAWFDRGILDEIIENTKRYYGGFPPDNVLYDLDEQLACLIESPAMVFVLQAPDYDEYIKDSKAGDPEIHGGFMLSLKAFRAKKSAGRWLFQKA